MVALAVSIGGGVALGSIQLAITRYYITDPKWNTFGNIILGGIALGVTQYTNIIRNNDTKTVVMSYGLTAFIGGLMNGIMPIALRAVAARNGRLGVSPLTGHIAAVPLAEGGRANGIYTGSYYPGYEGSFYRRSQSRAQGFASDVTRNPMAARPTTVPYNLILA